MALRGRRCCASTRSERARPAKRGERQLLRVRGVDVDGEPHAAAVADVGQRAVPFERGELVGERHQRPAAAFEHVAVTRAQGPDEPGAALAALIDEVRERVEVVEQEMRIDLASQALELSLERACSSRALRNRSLSQSRSRNTVS